MKKLEDTLTELQKQLILENFGKLLIGEISKLSGVKHRSVTKFLKNRGLKLNVNERKLLYYRRNKKYKIQTPLYSNSGVKGRVRALELGIQRAIKDLETKL